MAMRHPRLTVFTGAMSALALMHVMSAFFGYATTVIPRVYTYYLSSFLFAVRLNKRKTDYSRDRGGMKNT